VGNSARRSPPLVLFLRRANLAGDDRLVRLGLDENRLADADLVARDVVPLSEVIRRRIPARGNRRQGIAALDGVVLRLARLGEGIPALRLDYGALLCLLLPECNDAFMTRPYGVQEQTGLAPCLRRYSVAIAPIGSIYDERFGDAEECATWPQLHEGIDWEIVLGESGRAVAAAEEVTRLETKEQQSSIGEHEQASRGSKVVDPWPLEDGDDSDDPFAFGEGVEPKLALGDGVGITRLRAIRVDRELRQQAKDDQRGAYDRVSQRRPHAPPATLELQLSSSRRRRRRVGCFERTFHREKNQLSLLDAFAPL